MGNLIRRVSSIFKPAGGGAPGSVSASLSSFTSDDYDITANSVDDAVLTITARDASNNPIAGKSFTIARETIRVSAANSSVSALPATISADGVEVCTVTLTVRDESNRPIPHLAAADCVLSVSGSGNTVTQPTGSTNQAGQITGSFVTSSGGVKTASFVAFGVAITSTAVVTATGGSGQPFAVPSVTEFFNSTQFELSGGLPLDSRIGWMEDFSNASSYPANAEGWRLGTTAPPTRVWTGGAYDSGNIAQSRGMSGSIYSELIPIDSSEWTPLGMDGVLIKNIGAAGRGTSYAHTLGRLAGGIQYSNYIFQHRIANASGVADSFNAFAWSADIYFPADYEFGAQKMFTPMAVGYDSGIIFGNLHMNLGAGGTATTGNLAWQGAGTNLTVTSLATITRGRWWNFHVRITLNVGGTGTLRIYATDLGTDGLSVPSGGTPTLVYENTSYVWAALDGTSTLVYAIWVDWWANPVSIAAAPGALITNFVHFNVDQLILIREAP